MDVNKKKTMQEKSIIKKNQKYPNEMKENKKKTIKNSVHGFIYIYEL